MKTENVDQLLETEDYVKNFPEDDYSDDRYRTYVPNRESRSKGKNRSKGKREE
jgi:hypothetical protein